MGLTRPGAAPTVGTMGHHRELRMEHLHIIGRVLLVIGLFIISFEALGANRIIPDPSEGTFWFRFLLGGAVAACGWILSKHDQKIDKLMGQNLGTRLTNYETKTDTIVGQNLDSRLTYMELEWRNVSAQVNMLREQLPRDYHTKGDMDRRFDKLESSVGAVHTRLDRLLDVQHSPSRSVTGHGET